MRFELDKGREKKSPDIWYIYWTEPNGRGRHKSTGTKDRGEAELVKALFVQQTHRPKDVRAEQMSLQSVLLKYYERHGHSRFAQGPIVYAQRDIQDYLPGVTVAGFDDALQRRYIDTMMQTGDPATWLPPPKGAERGAPQADTTVARRLRVLRAAINMLAKSGELARDTIPYIRVPEPTERDHKGTRALKLAQLQAWFKAARTPTEKLLLLLWLTTLCRPMQALELTWGQIDFEEGTIDFKVPGRRKTVKGRAKLLMCPTLRNFLRPLAGAADDPVVLSIRDGKKLAGYGNQIRDLREKSGVGGSAYGIRKAGASYLANISDVPLVQIQAMLAHKFAPGTPTGHYTEADLPAAVRSMEELIAKIEAPWLGSASQSTPESWEVVGSSQMQVLDFVSSPE